MTATLLAHAGHIASHGGTEGWPGNLGHRVAVGR
jgi:hypothetical protein